jgi:DNA-directed RNA polymerase subunit A"
VFKSVKLKFINKILKDNKMSEKRLLTEYEIDSIISFIKPQQGIPIDTAMSVVNANKDSLRDQLLNQMIYPQEIPRLKEMIENQWYSSKIQAGESVGVIGAQSIGERQTQSTLNSVDWTDKILYMKNGKTFVEPIGQMIDQILDENKKDIKLFQLFQKKNTEYLDLPEGYYIPSGDEDGFNEWLRIEAVTRHLPSGKLVKVSTQSGRTVIASQCKSFLVWDGKKFMGTLGSDVKIGDVLPTSKNMPRFKETKDYFDMESIFPKDKYIYSSEIVKAREYREKRPCDWFSKGNGVEFVTPYKRGDILFGKRKEFYMKIDTGFVYIHTSNEFVSHIPDKIHLDNDFGFLIGIYLAEGWSTKTFVGISNNNEKIRSRVIDWINRYGITYHLVTSKGKNVRNGESNDLKIHSTLLARMFKIICETGSSNKFVPEFSYTAPNEFITGLIDGYFSGDGTINEKDGSIMASSASEKLLCGMSFLLSYFGIFGRFGGIQPKNNNVKSKNIKYSNTLSIRNGFAQKFAKSIQLTDEGKHKRLRTITLKKEYKYMCGKSQEEYPQERDVYFDKIVSIEYVEATTGLVYDFTVTKTRNFNLFNGLCQKDTFHKAGSGEKTATTGVPRVEEMLNATKDPKSVNCIVYTKDHHKSLSELRKTIGHKVVEITFSSITKQCDIIMDKEPDNWYKAFEILHGDSYKQFTDCLSLKLDMDILYEYKLDMKMIMNILSEEYSDMSCVFSPDNIGQLDIFVDTSNIDLPENRLDFINTDNAREIYLEEVVQPILYKIVICGIPGIENIFFNDDPNKFETNGSNYKKLLGLSFVDDTLTVSNNVWDIYNTLGVEAARQFLIEEFMELCTGINRCHIQLLSEKMTYSGSISSISRYTMRNEDCGPMGKASFEETMDNFLKAGAYGQKEATRGVSASIICGKRANIGTGVCELMMDVKALPNSIRVLHDVKEVMNISEFSSAINTTPIGPISHDKLYKRLEKKISKPVSFIDSDSESEDDEVVRLIEKDFTDCKYKANIYFGYAEINMEHDIDEDGIGNGNDEDQEEVVLSFNSKVPISVTLIWDDGIKIGKEVFSGFDKTHGVYTPIESLNLVDQGRFMRIVGNPVKIKNKSSSMKSTKNIESPIKKPKIKIQNVDNTHEMGYLDF